MATDSSEPSKSRETAISSSPSTQPASSADQPVDKPTTLSNADVDRLLGRERRGVRVREVALWAAIVVTLICGTTGMLYVVLRKNPPRLPKLEPDLKVLGEEVEVAGYFVRPPREYPRLQVPANAMPPGMRFFAWGGTKRPDTTAPVFNVMVGTPPPGERIGTPDQALADWIEASRRNHLSNWRETPFSNVEINGLTFTYKRWSGINAKSGLQIHGIAFLAMDGKNVIIIASQDVVWHHEEALKISESAAASFRRK